LLEEAALLLLDQPPSFSGSYGHGSVRFISHMGIDTACVIRSMARSPACGSTALATPSRQRSGTLTAELLLEEGSEREVGEQYRGGLRGSLEEEEGVGGGLRVVIPRAGGGDGVMASPWVHPEPAIAAGGGVVAQDFGGFGGGSRGGVD
jgi:hypothetical protein